MGASLGEGHCNPLQYPCLENPTDRERSLAGYSPWGRQQSDMIERLTLSLQKHYQRHNDIIRISYNKERNYIAVFRFGKSPSPGPAHFGNQDWLTPHPQYQSPA